jgi:hypothetical protein
MLLKAKAPSLAFCAEVLGFMDAASPRLCNRIL